MWYYRSADYSRRSHPVCSLYSLNKKRDMIARLFRISHNRTVAFEPLPAIFPRHSRQSFARARTASANLCR